MAQSKDYGLGPDTYPRGWFVIAESSEVGVGETKAVTFFGKDFALYRGQSGKVVLLDAYCKHMGTHLTQNSSAYIVSSGKQIEEDSIRCPYHGWRYNAEGHVDDIPYHDGPCPKSASITSYHVIETFGCILMWHTSDEERLHSPDFAAPSLPAWNDKRAIHWQLDHLGELDIHGIEILDNMADVRHLGPTHGSPCEYFENEFRDHVVIQRQGGFLDLYQSHLHTATWYTGPGILLSKQTFSGVVMFEMIANTPVSDGRTRAWHAALSFAQSDTITEDDIAMAKEAQAGVLEAFSADFEIWSNKKSATHIMQMKKDGPFKDVRAWAQQFYTTKPEEIKAIQASHNGKKHVLDFPAPTADNAPDGFEDDCFK